MSIQGDVVKGSQTRSVCLSYFPIRAGHFALQDNTTKMKAEIGTHAPTAFTNIITMTTFHKITKLVRALGLTER